MQRLCNTDDIPEREARAFDTPEGEIFITQRDGVFYAYKNICPHLGTNLEFMENQFLDMDREYIICSTHGALFTVENGTCVFGPCQGDHLTAVQISVHSDGGIYLVEV